MMSLSKTHKLQIYLVATLLLSGCILQPTEVQTTDNNCITELIYDSQENHSYQFWNINPMSSGNTSTITFNGTGELNITVDLLGFFHTPTFWNQGVVNYSLIHENETLFTVEIQMNDSTHTKVFQNISSPLTIQIRATGADNKTDKLVGDLYISQTNLNIGKMVCP